MANRKNADFVVQLIRLFLIISTCGLWLPVENWFKKKRTQKLEWRTEYPDYYEMYKNPIIKEHYDNIEKIKVQYNIIFNLKDYYGSAAERFIKLCERDIELAPQVLKICSKYEGEPPYSYYTFRQLAILYERRKEYEDAIDVCIKAIELGFTDEGEMFGRLARLLKKSGYEGNVDDYLELIKTVEKR